MASPQRDAECLASPSFELRRLFKLELDRVAPWPWHEEGRIAEVEDKPRGIPLPADVNDALTVDPGAELKSSVFRG
jgi:hypothetical protein